jgi:membrane protein implicated in regulation of membrane protease activity
VVPLERAIVNGHGRVQIADAYWDVVGPDLPAGTPVRVLSADGMTLRVGAAG